MNNVSVILPTRNNETCIGDLLSSIFSQNFNGKIEVLIMDSSEDRTPEIATKYSKTKNLRIVRVEPEDYNYGGTRNLGVSMTEGDILVFISTDVEIRDKYWLNRLVSKLEDPLVAGVFGRQIPKDDASPMEEFFIKYTYPSQGKVFHFNNSLINVDFFFSNTNSAIKRKVWEQIPLPEMLKSEDQEWAKRALLFGYTIIYMAEAVVYHSHNYTLKKVFKEYFDSGATMPYVYNHIAITPPNFIVRGLKYKINQFKYFVKRHYFKHIPYSIIYDFTKFLGYLLGTNYKFIPIKIRKILCRKSNHWDKYLDAIPIENF
jgi:rhamnosyltransferase